MMKLEVQGCTGQEREYIEFFNWGFVEIMSPRLTDTVLMQLL